MFFNFINLINDLSNEDYNRFIIFLNNCRDYPYFDTLYDIDDYNNDMRYFSNLFKSSVFFKGGEK